MISKGSGSHVYLTFDDGPGRYTETILDILKEKDVTASFFWVTRYLYQERPWRRLLEEGHALGLHTHRHVNLCRLDEEKQQEEIEMSTKHYRQVTGQTPRLFRPPFGQWNDTTVRVCEELQLDVIMWSLSSFDWELRAAPEKILSNIQEHLQDGDIILLHECPQTVTILPALIQYLIDENYMLNSIASGIKKEIRK
ncbi:polysaccharide deacetylase family protein [Alteribacillus sp. HJP-4]|uniref:polysaccharide deacetylase family protein n=1 Tax=Alteribacillus sp. HJP-4 TaxID=2775394 RepID=UPI0035CD05C8